MSFGISEKSLNLIIGAIRQWEEIERAGIFGSRGMGNYKNGSDVDMVIYGQNITDEIVNKLRIELNEEQPLPFYFDIVHYESLSHAGLKEHIDKHGNVFWVR